METRTTPSQSIHPLNFGCNNNKTLAAEAHQKSALSTRLLVSAAAVLLVVASAGFGTLFAWQVGSKRDAALGALSVAMALGLELSKPFSIVGAFTSLRQFRVFTAAALTLVGALAVGYSLQAELTFMSMTRGDLVAERAGDRDAAQRAEARYEKVQASLDELKPVSNKERDLNAYLARRDALQIELHDAEQDRRQAPAVAASDPGAAALAAYAAALGVKTDAQALGLWLPLIGVLALELGAAFSVVLVRTVNGDRVARLAQARPAGDPAAQEKSDPVKKRESPQPPKRATKRAAARRRDDDDVGMPPLKRGLQGLIESSGGVVNLSQRKLARRLGASRTTLQRALSELAEAGALILETSAGGTRLAVA